MNRLMLLVRTVSVLEYRLVLRYRLQATRHDGLDIVWAIADLFLAPWTVPRLLIAVGYRLNCKPIPDPCRGLDHSV